MNIEEITTLIDGDNLGEYMNDRTRAAQVVNTLYEADDLPLMKKLIRKDSKFRRVDKSIAYLWIFRRAILDNKVEMAKLLFDEIYGLYYAWSVIANVLEIDSHNPRMFGTDPVFDPSVNAYMAIMEKYREASNKRGKSTISKNTFFYDYISWRIVNYLSEGELLSSLILGNPSHLWYIPDINSKFGYDVFSWYLELRDYSKENWQEELVEISGQLSIFSTEYREKAYQQLKSVATKLGVDEKTMKAMEDPRRFWDNLAYAERKREAMLATVRNKTMRLVPRFAITSGKDVIDLVKEILPKVDEQYALLVTNMIAGRFVFLLKGYDEVAITQMAWERFRQ